MYCPHCTRALGDRGVQTPAGYMHPECAQKAAAAAKAQAAAAAAAQRPKTFLAVALVVSVVAVLAALVVRAGRASHEEADERARANKAQLDAMLAPDPERDAERARLLAARDPMQAPSMASAFKRIQMGDSELTPHPGAAQLALWAMKRSIWDDVGVTKDETSYELVMKDSATERGKRACWSGSIVEIQASHEEGGVLYLGGLHIGGMRIVRFFAARSTAGVVENSNARFCGMVTGRHSYANSIGGTTHAVFAVGLFDLPENHKVIVSGRNGP